MFSDALERVLKHVGTCFDTRWNVFSDTLKRVLDFVIFERLVEANNSRFDYFCIPKIKIYDFN